MYTLVSNDGAEIHFTKKEIKLYDDILKRFTDGPTQTINYSADCINHLLEFSQYMLSLTKKERKMIDNVILMKEYTENNASITAWIDGWIDSIDVLIELSNLCAEYNIGIFTNILGKYFVKYMNEMDPEEFVKLVKKDYEYDMDAGIIISDKLSSFAKLL